MASLSELIAYRDALEAARYTGERRVRMGENEIEYKSDAEMHAALTALGRQIDAASGTGRPAVLYINTTKGY